MTRVRAAAAFLFFALLFAWRVEGTRIGSGYLDPVGKIQAQDEAVYSAAAIHMAEKGGWMTPVFLDRFFLYKPPLVYWLSGASARLFGIRNRNLRLPSILMSAGICAIVGHYAGWLAAALVAANPLFFTMARRNMTDAILCAAIVALVAVVWRDGKLESKWSRAAAAAAIAASILVKSTAGVIPLAILAVAGLVQRVPLSRLVMTGALAALAAAPWFVYQYSVHQRWFWTEFVEIELLAYGAGAPPQATAESAMAFYARRLWAMDPWLGLLAACGLPKLLRSLRSDSFSGILAGWVLLLSAAIAGYQYRNVTYVLPAIPAMAMIAARGLPLPHLADLGLGATILAARLIAGDYFAASSPYGGFELIEQRCQEGRTNDLVMVGLGDQFYATLLPMAKVRYALPEAELPPKGFALDFRSMGIILSTSEFRDIDRSRSRFAPELQSWGLPSEGALGTVIAYRDRADLAALVDITPGTDFISEFPGIPSERHTARGSSRGTVWLGARSAPVAAPHRSCRM